MLFKDNGLSLFDTVDPLKQMSSSTCSASPAPGWSLSLLQEFGRLHGQCRQGWTSFRVVSMVAYQFPCYMPYTS